MRISTPTLSLLPFLVLSGLCVPILASRGDQLIEFRDCVKYCIHQNCAYNPTPTPLPLHLRLLFWTCPQECDYSCQRTITAERITHALPIEQFHGKWPFRRILGVQEPFSVLFSLANLYAHVLGLRTLKKELPRGYGMRRYYMWFGYLGVVCWVCSAVFHTRDFVLTERADYFAAGANVLYGSSTATTPTTKYNHISPPTTTPDRTHLLAPLFFFLLFLYFSHIYYLSFIRWSYTYNMFINVLIGALTNILWTIFSIRHYRKLKKVWAAWPGLIVTWLVMAMSLELLDFPPVGDALDAHSLWHAATVAPTVWWYKFVVRDARREVEELGGGGGAGEGGRVVGGKKLEGKDLMS
ncbi:Mn2+ homeostasis protein [Peziza echinospora]|nr:Mn2+ homeostasis protein [Peziza echinospora]